MKTILKVSEKQRLIVSEGYVYLICEKLGDNDFVSNCFKAKKDDVLKQFGSISELIEYLQSINDDDSVEDIFDFEGGYSIDMENKSKVDRKLISYDEYVKIVNDNDEFVDELKSLDDYTKVQIIKGLYHSNLKDMGKQACDAILYADFYRPKDKRIRNKESKYLEKYYFDNVTMEDIDNLKKI